MIRINFKYYFFLIFISYSAVNCFAQNSNKLKLTKSFYNEILLRDTLTLIKNSSPKETTHQRLFNYKSFYSFEEEHHTIFYLLESNNCGTLSFTLMPKNNNDDFDFMIFQADTGNIEKLLNEGKLTLIRSNISRVDKSINGITGLNLDSKLNFTQKGINPSFSKSINVKTGSKLLIVFDNVYDNGKEIEYE